MPYANNNGVRIYYEVEGEGRPLVLLHGATQSHDIWREAGYVEALRSRHLLVIPDARGHGASDKPHSPAEYGRQPMAEDVCAVLDALGIPRSDVLGFSMGGTAVYSLLNSAPDRVGAAVVLGEQPFRGMWEQGPTWIQRIQEGGMPAMVASIEERGPMQPERKQRLLASDPVATVACIRALLDLPSLESDLPSITTPCLLIAGEYDEAFDAMKSASSLMPNASFVALTGLGHIQSFRHTDLVVSRVIQFLDTVQSTKCA